MFKQKAGRLLAFAIFCFIMMQAFTMIAAFADDIIADEAEVADIETSEAAEEAADEEAEETSSSRFYSTAWSLLPPVIAIALALITKEVYSSLGIGIIVGALLYSNFNPVIALESMFTEGMIAKLADEWDVGILIFLVVLGIMVSLMNKAGGSAAYGKWASEHIKTRKGAMFATFGLGVLIFIDDYFNCLTVGSVMRPVTDKHRISRAKLAYLIDATAAPVCMIAPISSWAAAVAGVVDGYDGLELFIRAIPYNLYSLLTIVAIIVMIALNIDYGPMKRHELNAIENGDLYTTPERPYENQADEAPKGKGTVLDLILPVIILIICCVLGMIYTGGFFSGTDFMTAFADCDASLGLTLGSFVALLITFFIYVPRRVLTFKEFTSAIPLGFCAMVPAILILTFAWTLSAMTGCLGADVFVAELVDNSKEFFNVFLPAIVFLIAVLLAFATGTSWGTFGILIPIVIKAVDPSSEMLIIVVSACLAGAVCGDHCSPISDTTIMASAGARSDHINHVSTQLPYTITVAVVSFVGYILAGLVQNAWVILPVGIVLMIGTLLIIKALTSRKKS